MGLGIETMVGVGAGLAQQGIGMISQKRREKRSMKNQMTLNQQSKDLSLQMWKDTNYSAQKAEMEKAGLSTGLMYGMSGGGGTTASTGSGGSAPAPQQAPMDIQSIAQLGLLKAQKENIEADTANKKAESGFTTGAKTANTEATTGKLGAETKTEDEKRDVSIEKIKQEAIKEYLANTAEGYRQSDPDVRSNYNYNEKLDYHTQIGERSIYAQAQELENGLRRMGIRKSEAEILNMAEQIRIGKFNANVNATQMGLDKVAGTQLQELIDEIFNRTGQKGYKRPQIK